ncbi:hypothetical protein E1B28_000977 [Marasmius oreades]|uniref:rRNA biogenesis protein RRP36 n=1 Tax=Marasmius oreades TaxID=181124 RepID=A0A9P8AEY5_9AGAR|nr:uncharacterized protein E1B28_000977 [Marasmius oreades]KAG7099104.1 hypothetical protein E1B28_000977 [Marasmius oreades]
MIQNKVTEESGRDVSYDTEEDADAPRVSQWVDEDEDLAFSDPHVPVAGPSQLNTLRADLSALPIGTLRHAQNVLNQTESSSETEGPESGGSQTDDEQDIPIGRPTMTREGKQKQGVEVGKRSNKHAPIEVSSKKPVTRRRNVIEVKVPEVRDPRFIPMTGKLDADKFHANYSFLAKNHESELQTLRENLKRARKLLSSSPRELRSEREREVARLELAMKRTESIVNHDRQLNLERETLLKVKQEEQEKRRKGKGSWWMKNTAKKEALVKARYGALAEQGGQRAVKKAIERKRRKVGQKDKRSRPFVEDVRPETGWPHKKRKVGVV